jgi:enamine deaminase RidA (YjgF/YER057c/UK114 family)
MSGTIDKKVAGLGIELPTPVAPIANYVGFVRTGSLLFVSGQLCLADGVPVAKGKLGREVTVEAGQAAACAINHLTQVKIAMGDLDKVLRVMRLGGFVSAVPDFLSASTVMNSASEMMVAVFGDKGRHARTAVSVPVLPADAAVEVEGLFEVS